MFASRNKAPKPANGVHVKRPTGVISALQFLADKSKISAPMLAVEAHELLQIFQEAEETPANRPGLNELRDILRQINPYVASINMLVSRQAEVVELEDLKQNVSGDHALSLFNGYQKGPPGSPPIDSPLSNLREGCVELRNLLASRKPATNVLDLEEAEINTINERGVLGPTEANVAGPNPVAYANLGEHVLKFRKAKITANGGVGAYNVAEITTETVAAYRHMLDVTHGVKTQEISQDNAEAQYEEQVNFL